MHAMPAFAQLESSPRFAVRQGDRDGSSLMALLASYRTDQLINKLVSETDTNSPAAQKSVEGLKNIGPAAIPKIIEALAVSDKRHTMVFVDILASQVNGKTLPYYREGLADGGERVVTGTAWALSSSNNYNIAALLKFFEDPEVSKPALIEILKAHKHSLSAKDLLPRAYSLTAKEKTAMFALIKDIAKDDLVPDLIARMGGKDAAIKVHLIELLKKWDRDEINRALEAQLDDRNKAVRGGAVGALATRSGKIDIKKVANLLTDPDVEVQGKAVDALVKINHPDTIQFLVTALKDESEYARRSAVEVLNEICDAKAVKDLLDAIKDDDWWVRARAGDALAEIGGPKVINSVLELVKDDDEDIRRTAIEILNTTEDETAVATLIVATDDQDWWVRERAVDALAQIGNPEALPKLLKMLGANEKTDPVIIRGLTKIGDAEAISAIVPLLKRHDKETTIEAIKAIAHLADDKHAQSVRRILEKFSQSPDKSIRSAAENGIKELEAKFAPDVLAEKERAEEIKNETRTLLVADEELDQLIGTLSTSRKVPGAAEAAAAAITEQAGESAQQPQAAPEGPAVLDITALKPGDVIDGRYKYIEKIGKGAFGTVLLMQDMVVEEQLILKFLNQNVSSDEEMMKRFVHELRYSRMITHRNVIRIYDFLYLQGAYAISMEYFPSHTLSFEIPDQKPMSFDKALGYAKDMTTAMMVAHLAGVIHRDLKPANILVNDSGLLKIVDFGVAAAASRGDTQLTKTGYVIGSPKYMAPEQILGKKVDNKADIYSIGVIMYEMTTGVPPYSRGDHMSVMYQHVQGKAKTCKELNPAIPDKIAAIIAKCMSVDKTKRYQSMESLLDALNQIEL